MKINKILQYVGLLGLAVGGGSLLLISPAFANYDNIFPNSFTGINDKAVSSSQTAVPTYKLAVGMDKTYVLKSAVNMRIYSEAPAATTVVNVWGQNLCRAPASGDGFYGVPPSGNYTDYRVYGAVNKVPVANGVMASSGDACNENKPMSISIPRAEFKKDNDSQLYYVKFTATVSPTAKSWVDRPGANRGFVNRFSLSAPTGYTIAPEGRIASGANFDDGSAVMMEQSNLSRLPEWTRYSVKFGSDCTVKAPGQRAEISFYDLDNLVSGSNPKEAQYKYPLSLQLFSYPRNANLPRLPVPLNGTASNVVTPPALNNQRYAISFTAQPDLRYELFIYRIYQNNTVQFTLPFDGIHWNVPCIPPPELDPKTTVTPGLGLSATPGSFGDTLTNSTIDEGEDVFVHARIQSGGPATAGVKYTRQVWGEKPNGGRVPLDTKAGTTSIAPGTFSIPTHNENDISATNFSKLCAQLVVSATDSSTTIGQQQPIKCVSIAKTPTFHALGSDVRVGGSAATDSQYIDTSAKRDSSPAKTFGSWGEYGVVASGNVTGFSSAAILKNGLPGVDAPAQSLLNKLTFANSPGSGVYANANGIGIIPRSALKKHPLYPVGGTLPSGTITESRVYRSLNPVVITNDIIYQNASTSVGSMPQVVIIAPSISIAPNVLRVDAWLIADGVIDTCSGSDIMTVAGCDKQLVVNGPVMAGTLKLKRTYTDKGNKAKPSEIFNLRSDAYIWAHERYEKSGAMTARTSYVSELPPRY